MNLPVMKSSAAKLLIGLTAAAVLGLAGPSAAQQQASVPVDVELVLAVDISQSLDFDEHQLQRNGYVGAFRQSDVVAALTSGPNKRVAVTLVFWAGEVPVRQAIPWTVIDGEAAAAAFAERISRQAINGEKNSSISRALTETAQLIDSNAYVSSRQVIMLSGDGANAVGPPVTPARDAIVKQGKTIIGLPLMMGKPKTYPDIDGLDRYFEQCVVGGDGGFSMPLTAPGQISAALRRAVGPTGSAPPARDASVDCMAGEKAWAART